MPVVSDNEDLSAAVNVYSIPVEIWAEIFAIGKSMCDDADDPLNSGDDESTNHPKLAFQFVVSHAFQFFRDITLNTPGLWTLIRVNGFNSFEWIVMVMARSGGCDLDVRFELSLGSRVPNLMLTQTMDLVGPQAYRWKALSIFRLCERVDLPVIRRLCSCTAPRLRSLNIDAITTEEIDHSNINRQTQIFQGSELPCLDFVRLRGFALSQFRPRLDRVVTLHLDDTGGLPLAYATLHQILICSTSLAHLSVYGDVINHDSWQHNKYAIPMPSLRSLRIYGKHGEIYDNLLLAIQAPLLSSLTLKDVMPSDLLLLWEATYGNPTMFPNVTHLSFIGFSPPSWVCARFFWTFPCVTAFHCLWDFCSESSIIQELTLGMTPSGPNGPFLSWPRLTEMTFPFQGDEAEFEALEQLLLGRRQTGAPLALVHLVAECDEDMEDVSEAGTPHGAHVSYSGGRERWPREQCTVDPYDVLF